MIRAILDEGVIRPLEPLPPEWRDGRELVVAGTQPTEDSDDLNTWYEELQEAAKHIPPEDFERLEAALAEADRQGKEQTRREMGL